MAAFSEAQLRDVERVVWRRMEAEIERRAEERAFALLKGRITLDMIRAHDGLLSCLYRGVPVTREQFDLLEPGRLPPLPPPRG